MADALVRPHLCMLFFSYICLGGLKLLKGTHKENQHSCFGGRSHFLTLTHLIRSLPHSLTKALSSFAVFVWLGLACLIFVHLCLSACLSCLLVSLRVPNKYRTFSDLCCSRSKRKLLAPSNYPEKLGNHFQGLPPSHTVQTAQFSFTGLNVGSQQSAASVDLGGSPFSSLTLEKLAGSQQAMRE